MSATRFPFTASCDHSNITLQLPFCFTSRRSLQSSAITVVPSWLLLHLQALLSTTCSFHKCDLENIAKKFLKNDQQVLRRLQPRPGNMIPGKTQMLGKQLVRMSVENRTLCCNLCCRMFTISVSVYHNRLGSPFFCTFQHSCKYYSCLGHKQANISLCFVH